MSNLGAVLIVGCLLMAVALAEPRLQRQQQQQRLQRKINSAGQQHPYLFLTVPKGRANAGAVVKGFEIVEEEDSQELDHLIDNDNDDDDNQDDDDEEEDELEHQLGLNFARNNFAFRNQKKNLDSLEEDDDDDDQDEVQESFLRNAKPQAAGQGAQQMVVARDQAGAIMVPDGIIEIEGQSVLDEKTGKAALLVPRAALDAIPDGAVVALMERSAGSAGVAGDEIEEERANRVVVRRRKNSGRRNIRRRGTNVQRRRRRPTSQRRRRGGNRRRNVRVVRPNNRRRGNQRRRGQVVYQG
ncbi:hypothetical protein KR074_004566 [Drosophila pseudoananassae]|nr:hypothetical protein KR074_004566 [Drosophila pseudoananassae]